MALRGDIAGQIRRVAGLTPKPLRRTLKTILPGQDYLRRLMGFYTEPLAPERRRDDTPLPAAARRLSTRYSLIVPFYNVERYVDDFFYSIFSQGIDPEHLEIIAVDDGSTDDTAQRIDIWSRRIPGCIKYVHQDNQHQSVARNTGLVHATGEWVSFPDSDDFVSLQYLEEVDAEIQRDVTRSLSMVSCNFVLYREADSKAVDRHPLRFRFSRARTMRKSADLKDHIQLSVNSAWFRRDLIERHQLRFDPRVRPSFEDGHFANRYLLLNPKHSVVFLRGPTYYYRKRNDGSSTNDNAKLGKAWYLDALRFGYLDLLSQARHLTGGTVPRFIQRTLLYELFWRFNHVVDHQERVPLSDEEQGEFLSLMGEVFSGIESHTIETFGLPQFRQEHKVGLLGLMKSAAPAKTPIFVRAFDKQAGLLQLAYFSFDPEPDATAFVDGRPAPCMHASRRTSTFLGRTFYQEHLFWLPIRPGATLQVRVGGQRCPLHVHGKNLGETASVTQMVQGLQSKVDRDHLPERIRELRRAATDKAARNAYAGCWLLMDRDDKADDNAEHLYRYLMSIGKASRAFYVLRPDSADWERLKSDGFKLIPFNSTEHLVALINANFVISSHADQFIFAPVSQRQIGDLAAYRYVFLQHGVTKDNISRWLNTKPISLFTTATRSETDSIAKSDSPYVFSDKEVALTGLCRHDALLSAELRSKHILLMPTWRKFLAGDRSLVGMARNQNADLADTDFARRWRSLLNAPRLRSVAETHGLKIIFCPHPNLTQQLLAFDVPSHVYVRDVLHNSIQGLIAECAVLVTDYSSVAFDAAYIDKPVVYYQFDEGRIFGGEHVYQKGYFTYATDGFGPVCDNEVELIRQIHETLSGQERPEYERRRKTAFPYRDGRCCERVYRRILALEGVGVPDDVAEDQTL